MGVGKLNMVRRLHPVDRNLGDVVRGWGGLSIQSIGLLAAGYAVLQALELVLQVWSRVLGPGAGFLFPLAASLLAAVVLARVERRFGIHHALQALRYYAGRRTAFVFGPLVRPRRRPNHVERLEAGEHREQHADRPLDENTER